MLVCVLILAGCGGSGAAKQHWQQVSAASFSFQAPVGWKVSHRGTETVASRDAELVQVAVFPLVHAYTPSLFTKIETELRARMTAVATQTGGTLAGQSTVTAAGIRSHLYDVRVGDHVDEYVFVLRARREFQLLCRRKASSSADFCERLVSSFVLT